MKSIILLLILIYNIDCSVRKKSTGNLYNIQDPRKNSSYYDIAVQDNLKYGSLIGSVDEILFKRGFLNKTISKYKLIYYSPQLLPSVILSSIPKIDESNNNQVFNEPHEPIFVVDSKNGSIYIKTPSDQPTLEYLCQKRKYFSCFSCIFSLNIIYSTENKINADTIRVFIDDHNDESPRFQNDQPFNINISELSQIGDYFRLNSKDVLANDSDAFYNQITYYLSDNNDTSNELRSNYFEVAFTLEEDTLNLILKTHLDYEAQKVYELYLIAKDNGQLKSSKKLIVNIIDENDNSPVCEKSLFIGHLKENEIEKDFMEIRAFDLDSGMNAKLQYTILSHGSSPFTSTSPLKFTENVDALFEIDKYTGWLSVKKPLDYEKKTYYEIIIKVNDSNLNHSFTTYCTARVNLIDMNDNPAKMKIIKFLNESMQKGYYSLNTMSDSLNEQDSVDYFDITFKNQIEFYENNKPDLVLALIRVFDYDTLNNYKFQIQSVTNSPEDTSMFEIRASDKSTREYELIAVKSFDADTIQNYRLKIMLFDLQEDNGDDPSIMIRKNPDKFENSKNDYKVFLYQAVKILDLNDNKPLFFKKLYEFQIDENKEKVALNQYNPIEVFDLDTSELNSKIRYFINDSSAKKYIYINDSNYNYPLLYLNNSFDYEIIGNKFEFNLIAFDIDNNTDMTQITIKIDDTNDNKPIFLNDNSTFSIKENMPLNSFIGQLIAADKDSSASNSDVSFRMLYDHFGSLFKIHKSGVLSNKIVFNREIQSYYTLKIEAYDNGEPSLKTVGTFYVKIEDENDNEPIFVQPNHPIHFMQLKLNENPSQTLFDVKAEDPDLDENGRIEYFIHDTFNLLWINKTNGSVYFNKTFDRKNFKEIIQVNITAKDCGQPSLNKTINFMLYLNYDHDELPYEVKKQIDQDSKAKINNENLDEKVFEYQNNIKSTNDFKNKTYQNISNSVLIIILMCVLIFMIIIACFIFITIYKKYIDKKMKNNSARFVFNKSLSQNNSTLESQRPSVQKFKCLDQVKSYLKTHCTPSRLNTFKNLRSGGGSQRGSRTSSRDEQNLTVKDASIVEIKSNLALIDPILNKNNIDVPLNIDRLIIQDEQNEAILKLNEISRETKAKLNNNLNNIKYHNKSSFIIDNQLHYGTSTFQDENLIYSNETIKLNKMMKQQQQFQQQQKAILTPTYQEIENQSQTESDDKDEIRNYICTENLNQHVNTLLNYPGLTKAFINNQIDQDYIFSCNNETNVDDDLGFQFKQLPDNFCQNLNSHKLKQMLNPISSVNDEKQQQFEAQLNSSIRLINVYDDNLNMRTQVLNNLLKKL
jgi:hypothetical protein